jgi:hypothetical protein
MVSMQPITQSYLDEPSSCFAGPQVRPYNKGSVMDVLMRESPLMAYVAQVARLDHDLDDPGFKGTCFAPCKEYCTRYWNTFQGNLDHLIARQIILSSCLRVQMREQDLYAEATIFPSLHRYSNIFIRKNKTECQGWINGNLSIVKADQQCTNGMIHFINGMIDPEIRDA